MVRRASRARSLDPVPPAWPPLIYRLDELPPPLNHLYIQVRGGGKIRNPDVVQWQTQRAEDIEKLARAAGWPAQPGKVPLAVHLLLLAPNIYQWDNDGRMKVLFDGIAEGLSIDDRYFRYTPVYKQRGPATVTLVWIEPFVEGVFHEHWTTLLAGSEF